MTRPDYITLSGSGEPTLYSRNGELIDRIKSMTDTPVAVLTNGALLWRPEIRHQLIGADLVIPSLDGGDDAMFRAINRPHEAIVFEQMLNGLIDFRQEFQGQYWLEIVLLAGHNAIEAEIVKLATCVKRIAPDRVQLNTATRPPAEDYAVMVSPSRLEELAGLFDPVAEVIADYRGVHGQSEFLAGRDEVRALLRRRPCSVEGIAEGLGMHRNEVVKYLKEMLDRQELDSRLVNGTLHYSVK
jgi:wyosine [tRNA(Phe)-imidazoG37] synthetase (radical SAM superfamily)